MRRAFYILAVLSFAANIFSAQTIKTQPIENSSSEIVRVEAQTTKGFSYPNYLYVPKALRETNNANAARASEQFRQNQR